LTQGSHGLWLCALVSVLKNSQKLEKVVDSLEGRRLYTPQQRGRRAAGGPGVRSKELMFLDWRVSERSLLNEFKRAA
ncbi:hypothetical protein, partial [Aminobacter sp. LjRoot7]|uniref:hypothetical protein n=1 Tax=Aminobacter sp. LjRoot7 TaxID=3342335 RepID=UPI003F4F411D